MMRASSLWLVVQAVVAQQAGELTAADVDDGLNWDHFLWFKNDTSAKLQGERAQQTIPNPDLNDRVAVRVLDQNGGFFSCAVVEASTAGGTIELPAGTDGRLHVFPSFDGLRAGSLTLRAKPPGVDDCTQDVRCGVAVSNATGSVDLEIPITSTLPSQMDVTFVVDTTGSMGDELRYLQTEILSILQGSWSTGMDLRAGLVLYRDHGDTYVTDQAPLGPVDGATGAIALLEGASASGGGDYPEAMMEAMELSMTFDWRSGNVARVLFLVADAPPHDRDFMRTLETAKVARSKGIKVYALAASGVGDSAEYLMRLMSATTGARYTWLTDDSGIGNSHAVPKVLCYQVTRLDSLIRRILHSEMQGTRVEPDDREIIREVGQQEAGVCITELTTTAEPERDDGDGEAVARSPADGTMVFLASSSSSDEAVGSASLSSSTNVIFSFAVAVLAGAAQLPVQRN